ncbi:unnamed protein product, partial [Urochloa humidicola]
SSQGEGRTGSVRRCRQEVSLELFVRRPRQVDCKKKREVHLQTYSLS